MDKMIKFLAIGLFASLFSCEKTDLGLENEPIDSKIIVEAREVIEEQGKSIRLVAKTEEIYPCVNYSISTKFQLNENSYNITYTGIGEVDICFTAIGPATSIVPLGSLSIGTYPIELNNGNLKNEGALIVTDSEIKLSFGQLKGIEIPVTEYKRVPAQTYWGTIGYHTESTEKLAKQFIQELAEQGAEFNEQLAGDYWYYKIDQKGAIMDAENHGYYFVKSIIFNYSGDESELRDLIRTGAGIDKEDLSISISAFTGEEINNWSN